MPKREEDARFLKSERLLIDAAAEEIKMGGRVTVTNVCKRAGVFKSTFYRHYRNLSEMIARCEQILLEEFNSLVERAIKRKLTMEYAFRKWVLFVYRNQHIFHLSVAANQLNLLTLMMQKLKPLATIGWRSSPQKLERVYLIYSYEVIGVWLSWAKQENFDANKISAHTQELAFLTRTALQRLGGIDALSSL